MEGGKLEDLDNLVTDQHSKGENHQTTLLTYNMASPGIELRPHGVVRGESSYRYATHAQPINY
jgi:hypothetical protein